MAAYTVLMNSALTDIHALKATADPTVDGNWDEIGDPFTVKTLVRALWVEQDGTDLHVVTVSDAGRIAYHKFSTSSDTWTITDEEIVTDTDIVNFFAVSVKVRSDGDVIVLYTGHDGTNFRVRYARREATVWTTDIQVDNGGSENWVAGVIVHDPVSDRMHFFFTNDTQDDVYAAIIYA